jgi:2-oxoglutarate dehydrogenase complex dehydrogenase (E1) component-like enzyme
LDVPKTLAELNIDASSPNIVAYTSSIGVEFSHVASLDEQNYLYSKHEEYFTLKFSKEEKAKMLEDLVKMLD